MAQIEKRILLVEDDPSTVAILGQAFPNADSGIVVFHAPNLAEARRAIDDQLWRLIVTDGSLAKGGLGKGGVSDGIVVAQYVHDKDKSVPVFLFSGSRASRKQANIFAGTFVKPNHRELVAAAVKSVNRQA